MKKIVIASLALFASLAFAGSVTVEGQDQFGDKGAKGSTNYKLEVKESITKELAGDVSITQAQQDVTKTLSTRPELALTGTLPVGPVGVYTRVAVGEKYTNGANFAYYSVEPGVTYKLGNLTAKVGYRYRTAVDHPNVNKDTTDTVRVGLAYAVTAKDSVGVRYDRMTGDSFNHSYNFIYTRSF